MKKVIHKTVEAIGEFSESKVADKIVKPKNVEEIIVLLEKKRNIKLTKTSSREMEYYKVSKLLNDLSVSKFGTRKSIKLNYLSSGQCSANKN